VSDMQILPLEAQPGHEVVLDGCKVPHIEVWGPFENGHYSIAVDGRFLAPGFDRGQMEQVVWLLAHGMAVAAGYACHGSDARLNPHARRVVRVGPDPLPVSPVRLVKEEP
jgi:hypothetical protein